MQTTAFMPESSSSFWGAQFALIFTFFPLFFFSIRLHSAGFYFIFQFLLFLLAGNSIIKKELCQTLICDYQALHTPTGTIPLIGILDLLIENPFEVWAISGKTQHMVVQMSPQLQQLCKLAASIFLMSQIYQIDVPRF